MYGMPCGVQALKRVLELESSGATAAYAVRSLERLGRAGQTIVSPKWRDLRSWTAREDPCRLCKLGS